MKDKSYTYLSVSKCGLEIEQDAGAGRAICVDDLGTDSGESGSGWLMIRENKRLPRRDHLTIFHTATVFIHEHAHIATVKTDTQQKND